MFWMRAAPATVAMTEEAVATVTMTEEAVATVAITEEAAVEEAVTTAEVAAVLLLNLKVMLRLKRFHRRSSQAVTLYSLISQTTLRLS
jgi:hypothetical protein